MKKLTFLIASFFFTGLLLKAQTPFEGMIETRKISGTDTANSIFYLKDSKVKMDELNKKTDSADVTYLGNTEFRSLSYINHKKKIYLPKATNLKPQVAGEVEVTKTKNTKPVQGVKCTEYIVKNESEHIEISYWLGKGKFGFYEPFMSMVNPQDNIYKYFLLIDGNMNMMPLEAVEKVNGVEKTKLEVTSIQKEGLEEYMFDIPKDYKKFAK